MKAAICTSYGPPEVLQIRSVAEPRPKRNEVCIRLSATAVTASDCIVRGLKLRGRYRLPMRIPFGLRAPPRAFIGMLAPGQVEPVRRGAPALTKGEAGFGDGGFPSAPLS